MKERERNILQVGQTNQTYALGMVRDNLAWVTRNAMANEAGEEVCGWPESRQL